MSKMTKVKEAEAILDDLGLSVTKSFELYYRQIIAHRGLPFELQIPNPDKPEPNRLK
jgi:DNA-damage-inducible protein J